MSLMKIIAELRESIGPAIPQIIALLTGNKWDARRTAADTLSKLSEQGNISKSPI